VQVVEEGSRGYKVTDGPEFGNRLAVPAVPGFFVGIRVLFWSNIGLHDPAALALKAPVYPRDPPCPCPDFVRKYWNFTSLECLKSEKYHEGGSRGYRMIAGEIMDMSGYSGRIFCEGCRRPRGGAPAAA
jgi:hypothetical protein